MSDYLSCAETAKLVRQCLKEAFPSIKFSVRSSTYSGGASIDICWTDGPNSRQVEELVANFKGSYFDGSIDYKGSVYAMLDGKRVRFCADSIHTNRKYSDALLTRMLQRCADEYGCPVYSVEDWQQGRLYNKYGPSNASTDHWSVQSLVHQMCAKHTFLIGKESQTAKRAEILGSDGYSRACGSGKSFGDDEVVDVLRKAATP